MTHMLSHIGHMVRIKTFQKYLSGVAQWTEHQPANQRVAGLIPSQGTCLGCGPGHQLGDCERQPHLMSLSLTPSLPLSLKINK